MDPPQPLDVDPVFRAIVLRCLEKAPADRYASVAQLAAALAPFGSESARRSLAVIESLVPAARGDALAATLPSGSGAAVIASAPTAPSSVPASAPTTTLQGATGYAASRPAAEARRHLPLWLGGGVLAIAAAATAIVMIARGGEGSPGSGGELAEVAAKFDKAIERERCSEATQLAHDLLRLGGGSAANTTVVKCIERRMNALKAPGSPGTVHTLLAMAEEMFEADQYVQARTVVETMIATGEETRAARSLGARVACKEGVPAIATQYIANMARDKERDEAVAFCAKRGVVIDR